jgi:hypothetical protein
MQDVADVVEVLSIGVISVSRYTVCMLAAGTAVFRPGHQAVLLVPRLFERSARPSVHCGSRLRALRSAAVGAGW